MTRAPLLAALLLAWTPCVAGAAKGRKARAAAAARTAAEPADPIRHGPDEGAVVYVTQARAYLDAGAAEGLAAGDVLRLGRGGRVAGTCTVEAVAPHHAVCRSEVARPGDTFRVARPPSPRPPKELPRLVGPTELERRAEVVAATPVRKVEWDPKRAPAEPAIFRRAEVAVAFATWSSTGHGAWQQERAEISVRDARIVGGLRLRADLRALRWVERPVTARDRPTERTRLLVWEAQVSAGDGGRPYTLTLGRLVPRGIPGTTLFDGVQVGLRRPGSGEVGLFAGAVPEVATLAPARDRSTAGVYGSLDLGSGGVISRHDARAAVVTSPELGTRFEAELASYLLLGRTVNASAGLRAGVGGEHRADGGIDGAHLDVSGRPAPRLQIGASLRYWGLSVPDLPAPALFPGPERTGDLTVGWDLGGALVSATGGVSRDLDSGLERRYAGPTVSFPRLLGSRGGATLGYLEERGWLSGRSAYVQASLRPRARLRLTTRVSYAADLRDGADDDHELGLFAAAQADLAPWVSLRASVLFRAGARLPSAPGWSTGVDASLAIAGGF